MPVTRNRIEKNLQAVRENVAAACERAGRDAEDVTLIAVTKAVGLEEIKSLLDLGLTDLGENRSQQFIGRAAEVASYLQRRRTPLASPVRWHMIGHLQRNKVRHVLDCVEVIHSVDSLRLAEELNARAEHLDRRVDVLLQINCSKEQQKFGVAVGACTHLAEMIASLPHLRLTGLMTMAQITDDPEAARPVFVRLRELFEEMEKDGIGGDDLRHLSMGMSQDYAVAVEEGATILRIGSALFA